MSSKDNRFTQPWNFLPLHRRYRFTLDVAGHPKAPASKQVGRFYSEAENGLRQSWAGERVWCNPPYSNLDAWVRKAWAEFPRCPLIVMLLPSNRTEQPFWQKHVEPKRDLGPHFRVRFVGTRWCFGTPREPIKRWRSSPPFGCVLLVWDASGSLELPLICAA